MLKSGLFILLLFLARPSFGTVEILAGLDSGPMDFEDSSAATKEEITSINVGFHLSTRLSANLGRVLVGAVAHSSWHDMNLIRDFDVQTGNSWNNLSYGPYVGVFLTKNFKLNLEYYNKFTTSFKWAEGKAGNYFTKHDIIEGKGAAIGLSYAQGGFFYELLYQMFTPEKAILSDVNYSANSSKFRDANFKNMMFSVGFIF